MTQRHAETLIHASADVSAGATVGVGAKIWHDVHIREGAVIGDHTILGKGVYVDKDVKVGANCKIQNGSYLYRGTELEDGVFVGPRACFTNDRVPRAINAHGQLKTAEEWDMGTIHVCYGASIGAGVIVLPNVTIGRFAMVGAGAIVTRDVPSHGLVVGVRARLIGYVCRCGMRLQPESDGLRCTDCRSSFSHDELRKVALA
jgi:acetyltransferase-like isoleucine patch superfamily enzyme